MVDSVEPGKTYLIQRFRGTDGEISEGIEVEARDCRMIGGEWVVLVSRGRFSG